MNKDIRVPFYSLLLITAIVLVYLPGLSGGFLFDDYPHIVDNQALKISEWSSEDLKRASLSSQAGPLKRPVAMFTFAVNHLTSGLNPKAYLLTNVVIHTLNALLVTWISFLLLRLMRNNSHKNGEFKPILLTAFAIGALWGLHPYNLTSVNYIIQRMNSLSALFSLTAVLFYIYFRQTSAGEIKKHILLLVGALFSTILAILSKENALLLPLQIAAVELILYANIPGPYRYWDKLKKVVWHALIIGVPGFFIYLLVTTNWESAYQIRHYSLPERWLTEQRVLWTYLQQILLPNITTMGLYLDDYPISRSLFNPATTAVALLAHIALILLVIIKSKKFPVLSFAVLWFYSCHLLESTIFPLEIMFEHRNYLASTGPIFALVYYSTHEKITPGLKKVFLLLLAGLTLLFSISTAIRASHFGDWLFYPVYEAEHHPTSSRANFNAGRTLAFMMDKTTNEENKKYFFNESLKYFGRASMDKFQPIEPINGSVLIYLLAGKSIPPEIWKELERRLQVSSPGNNGFYIFKGLLEIANRGVPLLIQPKQIKSAFESALQNPAITGQNRGFALISYGIFECNIMNNCARAAELATAAVDASPGYVEFKVILASFYFNIGNHQEGNYWLKQAKSEDIFGYYSDSMEYMSQGAKIYWGIEKKTLKD